MASGDAQKSLTAGRLPAIDALKLLGCGAVMCIHTFPFATLCPGLALFLRLLSRFAVPFFFAVSGYFIEDRLQRATPRGGLRDASRTALRYYGVFLMWSVLYLLKPRFGGTAAGGAGQGIAASVGFKIHTVLDDPAGFLVNGCGGHLWFLSALSVSLLGFAVARRLCVRVPWLTAMAGVFVLGVLGEAYAGTRVGVALPLSTRNGLSIGGFCLAMGAEWRARGFLPRRSTAIWGVCAAMAAYLTEAACLHELTGRDPGGFNALLSGPLLALSVLALGTSQPSGRRRPWLEWSGRLTFGIYLCHVFFIHPVISLLNRAGKAAADTLALPLVFVLSFAVAAVLYATPGLGWLALRAGPRRAGGVAEAGARRAA